jgi:hypothetical protein
VMGVVVCSLGVPKSRAVIVIWKVTVASFILPVKQTKL